MLRSPSRPRVIAIGLAAVAALAPAPVGAQPVDRAGTVLIVLPMPAAVESQLRAELVALSLTVVPAKAAEASPEALARAGAIAAVRADGRALQLSFAAPDAAGRVHDRVALGRDAGAARRAAVRTSEILRAHVTLTGRTVSDPSRRAAVEPPPAPASPPSRPTTAFTPDPGFRSRAAAAPPADLMPMPPGPRREPARTAAPTAPSPAAPPRPSQLASTEAPPAPIAAPEPAATVRAARPDSPAAAEPRRERRAPRLTFDGGLAFGASPGGFGPSSEGALFGRWLSRAGIGAALRARLPIAAGRTDADAGSASARVVFVGLSLEAARTTAGGWGYGGGAGIGYGRVSIEGSAPNTRFTTASGAVDVALPFVAGRLSRRLAGPWFVGAEALVAVAAPTPAALIDEVVAARWGSPWVDLAFMLGAAW